MSYQYITSDTSKNTRGLLLKRHDNMKAWLNLTKNENERVKHTEVSTIEWATLTCYRIDAYSAVLLWQKGKKEVGEDISMYNSCFHGYSVSVVFIIMCHNYITLAFYTKILYWFKVLTTAQTSAVKIHSLNFNVDFHGKIFPLLY